jgi:hypothetical protein
MVAVAPSAFELWAYGKGYDMAPAVLPVADRIYADRQIQAAFDAWKAGSANTARMLTESTLETEALRERIHSLVLLP